MSEELSEWICKQCGYRFTQPMTVIKSSYFCSQCGSSDTVALSQMSEKQLRTINTRLENMPDTKNANLRARAFALRLASSLFFGFALFIGVCVLLLSIDFMFFLRMSFDFIIKLSIFVGIGITILTFLKYEEWEEKSKLQAFNDYRPYQESARYIPPEVKREVWRRDTGRCVVCGSREWLEYDHIIPVSKGGSNTARNIQLLCSECNKKKSDKIV